MREPGYYWVKVTESEDWEIARFIIMDDIDDEPHGYWEIMGFDPTLYEDKIFEIDERRIVREETTNEEMKAYCLKRLQELATNGDLDFFE